MTDLSRDNCSTVSVFGAKRPLREGHVESEQDALYGVMADRRWFVGGQSARAHQAALHALENLLDGPEGYRVGGMFGGLPHACASGRHGNCLSFDLLTPRQYEEDRRFLAANDEIDWRCECGCLNRPHEAFCYRCGAGSPDDA